MRLSGYVLLIILILLVGGCKRDGAGPAPGAVSVSPAPSPASSPVPPVGQPPAPSPAPSAAPSLRTLASWNPVPPLAMERDASGRILTLGPLDGVAGSALSPDGQRLAMVHYIQKEDVGAREALLLVDLRTQAVKVLSDRAFVPPNGNVSRLVGWAGDNRIAVLTDRSPHGPNDQPHRLAVRLIDVITGTETLPAELAARHEVTDAWVAADGQVLIVHAGEEISRLELATGRVTVRTVDWKTDFTPFTFRRSPDGERVAYNVLISTPDEDTPVRAGVHILDLRTGREARLGEPGVYYDRPVWSPDSERLVLGLGRLRDKAYYLLDAVETAVLAADEARVVTASGEAVATFGLPGLPLVNWGWSESGDHTVLYPGEGVRPGGGTYDVVYRDVYLADPGESQPRHLVTLPTAATGLSAAFAPDGNAVFLWAWEAGEAGGSHFYILDPDTGTIRKGLPGVAPPGDPMRISMLSGSAVVGDEQGRVLLLGGDGAVREVDRMQHWWVLAARGGTFVYAGTPRGLPGYGDSREQLVKVVLAR